MLSFPQVRNYQATTAHVSVKKPSYKAEDKQESTHVRALQALSNGHDVPYEATMRTVLHEGGRPPRLPPRVTQKHVGYIRNESGGFFTS